MSTLDSMDTRPLPEEVSPWPTGSRYGLLAGLVLIVLSLGLYLGGLIDYTGQDTTSSVVSNIVNWGTIIVAVYLAVKQHRDEELGGLITFGRSFYVGFIVSLVIGVLSAIWSYVFFVFVDPELISTILEVSKEQMIDQQGMSASDAEDTMGMISWMFTPAMFAVFGLVGSLFSGVIISLIVGAVMKRDS